jgi:hypothetical protein
MDVLGSAQYEVYLKARGGDSFVSRIQDITAVSWGRKLNDVSEASISVNLKGLNPDSCGFVSIINPWEHELAIYRNGSEVWCGPVVGGEINQETMTARFDAKDLGAWFDKRWIEVADTDQEFVESDIVDIFTWLIGHAYYRDPWNMDWHVTGKLGVPMDRIYVSYNPPSDRWGGNYTMVGNELRDLSNSGVDYTVTRRRMVVGNIRNIPQEPARLTDQHWATPPTIIIVGTAMATQVAVAGGSGGVYGWDDDQIWIERSDAATTEKFGTLQSFESVPTLDDVDTRTLPNPISQRAYQLHTLKSRPFEYLRGGKLAPNAPISIDALVPGRQIQIDLTQGCRTIEDDYLLISISVSYSETGEVISLEMVPPGAGDLKGT